ncbi:rhodanese-like domain-containing protein [Anaeromyxobacter paludicola]|uniref:Rhodanese domain-containing protein n=1 Tax=Anaeromyxobacter paludicola TaxID=2918171 RepID=A0ABN6N6F9_9BACT|nr:rhodanese-like domain-containing protein [Anaeromyxobacter paludicola]BDG07713.1 hypothetical protein AMPC_08260 [Anaeromyxobacter paludicola]
MRNLLLMLALACPLALPLAARAAGGEGFEVADVARVASLVGKPGVYVFDANPPEIFAKGHVPGAKHVHYSDYPASVLPADKGAVLVFYCANKL